MKQRVIRRFQYLWIWELFNAIVVFPGFLFSMQSNIRIGLPALLATAVVSTILVIGAVFAFIKHRDLKNGTQRLSEYKRSFQRLRWIIPLLLLIVGLVIYSQFQVSQLDEILLSSVFYLLAVLEYINYFYLQLMYDNRSDLQYLLSHRRLKRGLIAREFDWGI